MLASAGFYYFEAGQNPNVRGYLDALWMAFVVIVPAASRAVAPVTVAGRVMSVFGIILGIGFLGLFTATLATSLVEMVLRGGMGLTGFRCEGHILVCGWSPRGGYLLEEICSDDRSECPVVILADLERSPVEDDRVLFLRGHQTSYADLTRANATRAATVILLGDESLVLRPGDADARTILAAITIRELNPGARIVAEVLVPENVIHLRNAGITEVLVSNRLMGNALARSAFEYGTISVVSELLSVRKGSQIYRMKAREPLVGKRYGEAVAFLQEERGQTLIGLERGGAITTNAVSMRVEEGDNLFVIAASEPG